MAGIFTQSTLILAAILVTGLPSVVPIDYNTCKGGTIARTCEMQFSSHCCKSGAYLSATCCRNSCIYPGFFWSTTETCVGMTNSMCCSTKALASESCCNFASYSRTSTSSTNGDYLRSTYRTCTGGFSKTEYCTDKLSTVCCSSGYYARASCCRPSTCGGYINAFYADTCYGTSTYCCSSSRSCCNSYAYDYENRNSVGAIIGGVFGGVILLLIIIVVPVSVVCCCGAGTRGTGNANTTVVAVTAGTDQVQPQAAYQQAPPAYYQPPPYGYNQPPAYGNQAYPQPQPGPTPVEQPSSQQ